MKMVSVQLTGMTASNFFESSLSRAYDNGTARDVVELALDHALDNEVGRAYDRGERFHKRVKLFDSRGNHLPPPSAGQRLFR
jgi:hypothetical protein